MLASPTWRLVQFSLDFLVAGFSPSLSILPYHDMHQFSPIQATEPILPVLRSGYEITIFAKEPVDDADLLDALDFSAFKVSDDFDGKFWHNDELKKLQFHRYILLTDEQINKYGILWLYELITGNVIANFKFAELTLLLALQIKSLHRSDVPLFADFLMDGSNVELNLLSSYDVKLWNMTRGSNSVIDTLNSSLGTISQCNSRNFDWNNFLSSYFNLSTKQKAIFIPLLALVSIRYCSTKADEPCAMPVDLYHELPIHPGVIPPAHYQARTAIMFQFGLGSPNLRAILIPTLAIHLRLRKTQNIIPVHGKIQALLDYAVMGHFAFRGLYTIKSYMTACDTLSCHDGSFLSYLISRDDYNYSVLEEFHSVYAKNDPNRSAYPWSRCLDLHYLEHYDSRINGWICSLMTAIVHDSNDEIWLRKDCLRGHSGEHARAFEEAKHIRRMAGLDYSNIHHF